MSAVSRKFQSQSLIFDEKLLLMDQRMTTITLKEQQQPESVLKTQHSNVKGKLIEMIE